MKRDLFRLKGAMLSSCALAMTGCMSIAAIEPVRSPPVDYQADVSVQVEFLHPARVGTRCAERGVSLFGMPMPNAMACANTKLMTLPNPCDTVTGGWYAEVLCREIAHTRGWEADEPEGAPRLMSASWTPDEAVRRPAGPEGEMRSAVAIRVEFVDAGDIGLRCAERGAVAFGRPTLNALSCSSHVMMSLPNPCSLTDAGWYANLLCHEMGHVNGWPASHPGRSFLKDGTVPVSHTIPVDDGGYVMNFIAALQKAQANSQSASPVRATVLANLADSPARAEEIALRAGIRQFPDVAMPRLEALPPRLTASLTLPLAPSGALERPDFSRPMGPLALRRSGTRLSRERLEALFAGADGSFHHGSAFGAEPLGTETLTQDGPLLQEAALTPELSEGLFPQGLRSAAPLHAAREDRVEAPAPYMITARFSPVRDWQPDYGPGRFLPDRILPLLPENY